MELAATLDLVTAKVITTAQHLVAPRDAPVDVVLVHVVLVDAVLVDAVVGVQQVPAVRNWGAYSQAALDLVSQVVVYLTLQPQVHRHAIHASHRFKTLRAAINSLAIIKRTPALFLDAQVTAIPTIPPTASIGGKR